MRFFAMVAAGALVCGAALCQPVTGPVIVLLGAPGSGKTTQAAALSKEWKIPIVSAADLIKDNAAELKKAQTRGISGIEPETDPLLNRFFEQRLKRGDLNNGMILDGYPSTKDHADFLAKLVNSGILPKPIILNLQISDEEVRKRVGKDHDLPASIEQRLKDYHRETSLVQIYFPNADITNIDGAKKPKTVTKKINEVLRAKLVKPAAGGSK